MQEARMIFRLMQLEGVRPEKVTCVTVLHACNASPALEDGKIVHLCCQQGGFEKEIIVANALLNMYAKCEAPAEAQKVFDELEKKDIVSWTTIVSAYSLQGQHEKAYAIFKRMDLEGVRADRVSIVTLLEACCSQGALETGKVFHDRARESGLNSILMVRNAVINMYGKCGSLQDAREVFDKMDHRDVISWNTIIGSYAHSGLWSQSVELFFLMKDVKPDNVTLMTVANAAASLQDITSGKKIHERIVEQGLELDPILGTGLVNMYGKCGYLEEARDLFDRIPEKRLVLWNCLLSAYVQYEQHEEAVKFFKTMDMEPDKITYITVLNACAGLLSLREGKSVHQRIVEAGLEKDVFVGTALLDMYAKCGTLQQAFDVFESLPLRNNITWNSMVAAFAQHGRSIEAVTLFREMLQEDIPVDKVTFVNALAACSHGGLTEEAAQYFTSLVVDFELQPSVEHYGCMVDLLGRLGWLEEAEKFIAGMPVPANSVILATFLAACRMHGDIARAKRVVEKAVGLNPGSSSSSYVASSFVALSSIYAEGGEFEDAASSRKRNRDRSSRGWREVGDEVCELELGEKIHQELQRMDRGGG
ncbi:pentatricopeptide repeat-containing protein At2g13600 [Selaginella moellendorffii]|uniref:pentatricopeptide repeat-containing protein At2g13600 n=1 Tax=Selaginella moellendorffii TaxID=88036 RepID=UPI000D1CBAAD|nr:pentatricopeptide repeat-containing protein At2g13600 [Selaginella moellendorffii]|eukprot:XP_024538456.1 pentatricopeptide repeat-containing protein At2g13600 [Selaginella moellendorffii]